LVHYNEIKHVKKGKIKYNKEGWPTLHATKKEAH